MSTEINWTINGLLTLACGWLAKDRIDMKADHKAEVTTLQEAYMQVQHAHIRATEQCEEKFMHLSNLLDSMMAKVEQADKLVNRIVIKALNRRSAK